MSEPAYVLGHAPAELARLRRQGEYFADITRRALTDAGLSRGARVLDIGCGSGDLSMLAADMVGLQGSVVGIDRAPEAIAAARQRARDEGRANVTFMLGTIGDISGLGAFDALVGRFVLMHQADPAMVLRKASGYVRHGGLVVMLESVLSACVNGFHSWPVSDAYVQLNRSLGAVVRGGGADVSMGLRLREVFLRAGLPAPTLRMEARIDGGADAAACRYIADSVRSLQPFAAERRIADCGQLDVDGLEEALGAELSASDGVLVSPPVVSAWTVTKRPIE